MNARRRLAGTAVGSALALAAAQAALAPPAHAAISDTPGSAPAVMSTCGVGPPVTEPAQIILTCADGNNYVTGIVWGIWSADHAVGIGTEHVNLCEPDCADGSWVMMPAAVYLDQPQPLGAGQGSRFSHAEITTTNGPASYKL